MDKIFTISERQFINDSKNPFETVWLLWSMKESAYKIYNRNTGIRAFNPHKFECVVINSTGGKNSGSINFLDQVYYASSTISDDSIATVASTSTTNLKNIKVVTDASNIIKVDGLPFIRSGDELIPVSISHHGRFVAVVSSGCLILS